MRSCKEEKGHQEHTDMKALFANKKFSVPFLLLALVAMTSPLFAQLITGTVAHGSLSASVFPHLD